MALPFLLKRKNPKKDFLFFPYAHKDNIGTVSRFQIFLPLLERDKFSFDIFYTWSADLEERIYYQTKSRALEYFFLARVFRSRLFQVMKAGNYKSAFFQRGLFPNYYDQYTPYLEKLLTRLNRNVTVDFFDADYMRNKMLVDSIAMNCNKICVVNNFLAEYFSRINSNVFINELALRLTLYKAKSSYLINERTNIFWTGDVLNSENLKPLIPILEKINETYPIQLTMVSRIVEGFESNIIRRIDWTRETFFDELFRSDIAIYPAMEDTEFTRGKVAYKNLEYGASALPVVASPFGLSPHFENEKDVLLAHDLSEWETQIVRLIKDEGLRKKFGEHIRLTTEKFHTVESAYKNLLKILQE